MKSPRTFHYRLMLCVLLIVALTLTAAGSPPRGDSAGVILKAQQSVTVTCLGDDLIISPYGDTQAQLVCRVWVSH